MPDMIRTIADSAADPQCYDIIVDAQPGASLESLWNDQEVRRLLGRRWDDVIVQGESRAQSSDAQAQSFQAYGTRLLSTARLTAVAPRLVVNWNYEARLWDGTDPDGSGRNAYYTSIQAASKTLSERTGARLSNIGHLWAEIETEYPDIVLTEDGNHPTLAGSYLFALMLYGDLSKRDVGLVTYLPAGLDLATAIKIREAVKDYESLAT